MPLAAAGSNGPISIVNAAGSDASITRQILQAADIVEVVSRYVTLRKAGKDYKALCPFHAEKTPSFYVSPSKQIFKCFGCGVGGDAIKFLQLKENLTFAEALARETGYHILDESEPSEIVLLSRLKRPRRFE